MFDAATQDSVSGGGAGLMTVRAGERPARREALSPVSHIVPYDALTDALLGLYEDVRAANARRARKGSKPEYAGSVADVERMLIPDLLSDAIALEPGCRVRVRIDASFRQGSAHRATRGRIGTVRTVGADDEITVCLDLTRTAAAEAFVYERDALVPIVGVDGNVLRAADAIEPSESQVDAMMQVLTAELGTARVNSGLAARLLAAANAILNQNPAAGPVSQD